MVEDDWSDLDPSEFTVDDLEDEIQAIETVGELTSIKQTEKAGDDRKGAKRILSDRVVELEDEEDEEDKEMQGEEQEGDVQPDENGMVAVDDLRSHPENSEIYGGDMDVSGLVADMQADGFDRANPLTVAPRGVVVKGNRRLLAAEEVGIEEVPVVVKEYDSEAEEVYALVMDNARQRERTPAQKWREAKAVKPAIEEGHNDSQGTRSDLRPNLDESSGGRTDEDVAEQVGIGGKTTYRKLNKVMEAAEDGEEVAQGQAAELESGEQSIHGAYTTLRDSRKDDEDSSTEDDAGSSEEEQQGTDKEKKAHEGNRPPDSIFGGSGGTEKDIDTEGTSIGGNSPVEGESFPEFADYIQEADELACELSFTEDQLQASIGMVEGLLKTIQDSKQMKEPTQASQKLPAKADD